MHISLGSESDSVHDNFQCDVDIDAPQLFTQMELKDLVRDLVLSKESSGILSSRFKEKKFLFAGTCNCFVQKRGTRIYFLPFTRWLSNLLL
ncbi:hypothetical protein AVEN_225051-1 [Araneus ventricosus]|uniref:Uncharacterized protein n=1 Tax=Araneus ventricosus TaxID=182803 RepID=A0A4Y2TPJ7_ARAVE|nr:hypothetical protein AVEN_225051-1 [Araneus ventricosus]